MCYNIIKLFTYLLTNLLTPNPNNKINLRPNPRYLSDFLFYARARFFYLLTFCWGKAIHAVIVYKWFRRIFIDL